MITATCSVLSFLHWRQWSRHADAEQ